MFIKFFKDRSNKKFIRKALENRTSSVNGKKIQTVGIILNLGEYKDYEKLRLIFQNYGINENKIKFIAYLSERDTKLNHWDSYFESKDFGWNGAIKNLDLQEFIETDFDALISYYKKDNLELNYATACSKANFKIGLSNYDQNLNDFIIDIKPNFIDIFGKELDKYLTGLKKIT
tara:strand:- start:6162 stop:6683 length:522 start_codon:yes stop_codon:yes gene_type:complete